ncbi:MULTISPECIES: APC family permease [unclassified Mycolicibacterium]|uniref:APC family permease n=1 Tax=unclassified Mycolicibacterium TaxID=2636767 RepID=UPI002ED81F73
MTHLDRTTPGDSGGDGDSIEAFGYAQELPRVLKLWTNFAIGFAFISPVVGLYTVVVLGTRTAGPAWVLAMPVVIACQLLVALVYTQLAERWPIAGGIYQWSRRLIGARYGWWAGWVYIWALTITLSTVAYSGGLFLAGLFGIDNPSLGERVVFALILMAVFTFVNAIGLDLLKWTLNIGIAAEVIATLGISIALITFFREHPFSVLWDTSLRPEGTAWWPAFVAAIAISGWIILGFDACGSLAEETQDPKRDVPRAILISLFTVGLVDLLGAAALMLASPDLGAIISGEVPDPVSSAVENSLGTWAAKPFLAVVIVSFTACGIAVQASTVRVLFSFARDRMVPFSTIWSRVSKRNHSPVYATLLIGTLASLAFIYANALSVLVSFATAAYYVSFLAPVAGVLYVRMRGRWNSEGRWSLGKMGVGINMLAAVWLVFELINIAWPRSSDLPWWQNWAVEVGFVAFGLIGLVYFLKARPDRMFTTDSATMAGVPLEVLEVEAEKKQRNLARAGEAGH